MLRKIPAGQFKACCLKIMDDVNLTKKGFIITKRNKPIAKIVPIKEEKILLFGCMKDSIQIIGNIIEPINEDWDAAR